MTNNTLSNNPFTVYNGFQSASRNMILSSSVAVVFIGFSEKLGKYGMFVRLSALLIIIISMAIGLKAVNDFDHYIDTLENNLSHIPINSWKQWKYINYTYIIILTVITVTFVGTSSVRIFSNSKKRINTVPI